MCVCAMGLAPGWLWVCGAVSSVLMPWGLSPTENSDSGDVFRVVQGNLPFYRGIVCVCTLIGLCDPVQEPGGSSASRAEESTAAWRTLRLAREKPGLQKMSIAGGKKALGLAAEQLLSTPVGAVLQPQAAPLAAGAKSSPGSLQPCP